MAAPVRKGWTISYNGMICGHVRLFWSDVCGDLIEACYGNQRRIAPYGIDCEHVRKNLANYEIVEVEVEWRETSNAQHRPTKRLLEAV